MTKTLIFGVVLAMAITACAGVLGIDDGVLDNPTGPDTSDGGSSLEAETSAQPLPVPTLDGAQEAPDAAVDVIVPDGCTTEQPDGADGVFVSLTGSSAADCGSKDAPCNTIQGGLTRAKAVAGTSVVYVASGTYDETVALAPGITVQGGWDFAGGKWLRQCASSRAGSVIITGASSGTGVRAESLDAAATLDTLTISVGMGGGAASGQSLYGIFATGAATSLVIRDVTVNVGVAGNGVPGVPGAAGDNGSNCSGASGSAGSNGNPGAGAPIGVFALTGYAAAAGAAGAPGTAGSGTTAGAAQCGNCASCGVIYPTCEFAFFSRCGTVGTNGCGGGAGAPGKGGQGGGSSIALYAWQARVEVSGGGLRAGSAGNGGVGGAGGVAGNGTTGTAGMDASPCSTLCSPDGVTRSCQRSNFKTFAGGAAGSRGGPGGAGGAGGGGAGGHSYAIYQASGAMVSTSKTLVAHGAAGVGAMNGSAGNAADTGP